MRRCGALLAMLFVAGCLQPERDTADDDVYAECLDLYTEYVLPNSMAREDGFDLDAHLKAIKKQRETLIRHFDNTKGRFYLIERTHRARDNIEKGFLHWALAYLNGRDR